MFGLLEVELPVSWKVVTNEPAKNLLESDEFVVMEKTRDWAPERPTKGGADHKPDLGSQIATAWPGEVKPPPTHTFLSLKSQNMVSTWAFGALELRGANVPEAGVYDATLIADVPSIEENEPAR